MPLSPRPLSLLVLLATPTLTLSLAHAQEAAAPVAVPAATADLAQRLDDIEQQARIANRRAELLEEAAATKKKEAPTFQADEKGFGLASVDKAYEVKIRGLVQVDGRRAMGDSASDPTLSDRDTFVVRRLRPIIDGTVLGLVDFRLMPDFGNNSVALLDGYLDAHPRPWLRLRAGKFKPPIGLERLQNDAYLPLIERSLDSNLTPQRDVGLQLWGDVANALVRYEIAIFNGVADSAQNDIDNNHAKSYAGRIFIRPFQADAFRGFGDLGFGVAFSTGNEKGSPTITNGAASNTWLGSFRSAGQNTIFSYLSSTTDVNQTVYALKRHTRINPQLYYYTGPIGFQAEWVKEYQELAKGSQRGAVNNNSGHVTLSYVIGGDNSYDGAKPRKVADWATKELGAVEIAARYNWLDIDDVAFQGSGLADASKSVTKAQGFDFGVNWYLSRNIKISGNWEHTSFDGGNSVTRSGAKVITNRATEKVLAGRFQVAF
jgi:phosphate-selective porin OprO/OprP